MQIVNSILKKRLPFLFKKTEEKNLFDKPTHAFTYCATWWVKVDEGTPQEEKQVREFYNTLGLATDQPEQAREFLESFYENKATIQIIKFNTL